MGCRAEDCCTPMKSVSDAPVITCLFCDKGNDERIYGSLMTVSTPKQQKRADNFLDRNSPSLPTGRAPAAHHFCLLFSSGLPQAGESDSESISGFLLTDIQKELNRGRKLRCSYCKRKGATIGCACARCKQSYHYVCGKQHSCMFLYEDNFRSYCPGHRPIQPSLLDKIASQKPKSSDRQSKSTVRQLSTDHRLRTRGDRDSTSVSQTGSSPAATNSLCYICYCEIRISPDSVTDVIISPCCTRSCYHRACLEDMAYSAGIHFFRCPLCNNQTDWQRELTDYGIYIPDRDAAWELEPHAYTALLERRVECDAIKCFCPQGRQFDGSANGSWKVMLCYCCGSQGVHVACAGMPSKRRERKKWVCADCKPAYDKLQVERCKEKQTPTRSRRKRPKAETPGRPSRYTRSAAAAGGISEVTNLMLNSSLTQD